MRGENQNFVVHYTIRARVHVIFLPPRPPLSSCMSFYGWECLSDPHCSRNTNLSFWLFGTRMCVCALSDHESDIRRYTPLPLNSLSSCMSFYGWKCLSDPHCSRNTTLAPAYAGLPLFWEHTQHALQTMYFSSNHHQRTKNWEILGHFELTRKWSRVTSFAVLKKRFVIQHTFHRPPAFVSARLSSRVPRWRESKRHLFVVARSVVGFVLFPRALWC